MNMIESNPTISLRRIRLVAFVPNRNRSSSRPPSCLQYNVLLSRGSTVILVTTIVGQLTSIVALSLTHPSFSIAWTRRFSFIVSISLDITANQQRRHYATVIIITNTSNNDDGYTRFDITEGTFQLDLSRGEIHIYPIHA